MTPPETPPLNRVKRLLAAGQPSFGMVATIPSIQVVQILGRAGLDWLLIDMEHGPIDLSAAHAMITATAGTATVPFVRIAWNHPWLAKPALDLGALGIAYTMIRTRAEAEAAVRATHSPPRELPAEAE
jgi:4-hydroxy-2-oxoheptanedioate aldolase